MNGFVATEEKRDEQVPSDEPKPLISISSFEKTVKIKLDLFERLIKTQVLLADASLGERDGMVDLSPVISGQYMNGFTFSRYLIALKLITVSLKFKLFRSAIGTRI